MSFFAGDRDAALSVSGYKFTDHNRSPLSISYDRLEDRRRMANGRLRVKHVDNKLRVSASWESVPNLDSRTVDGNAGAGRMKSVHDSSPASPLTVVLTYREGSSGATATSTYTMVFASFSYEVVTRSPGGFDLVNVSLELEEV